MYERIFRWRFRPGWRTVLRTDTRFHSSDSFLDRNLNQFSFNFLSTLSHLTPAGLSWGPDYGQSKSASSKSSKLPG
jgi:hypothetical protein